MQGMEQSVQVRFDLDVYSWATTSLHLLSGTVRNAKELVGHLKTEAKHLSKNRKLPEHSAEVFEEYLDTRSGVGGWPSWVHERSANAARPGCLGGCSLQDILREVCPPLARPWLDIMCL